MYKFIRFARGIGLGRVVCLVLLAALVLLRIWDPGPLKALRLRAFDYYQQIEPRRSRQIAGTQHVCHVGRIEAAAEEGHLHSSTKMPNRARPPMR